jgi:hypothetical protein
MVANEAIINCFASTQKVYMWRVCVEEGGVSSKSKKYSPHSIILIVVLVQIWEGAVVEH